MSIRSLTKEKVEQLNKLFLDKQTELDKLKTITIEKMYLNELNKIKIDL